MPFASSEESPANVGNPLISLYARFLFSPAAGPSRYGHHSQHGLLITDDWTASAYLVIASSEDSPAHKPPHLKHAPPLLKHPPPLLRHAPPLLEQAIPSACEHPRHLRNRPARHRVLSEHYRGPSLIRNRQPVGLYSRPLPRVLWRSQGGGCFLLGEVPL